MSDHDAYNKNAADLVQVQSAGRRSARDLATRGELLRGQVSTYAGRRFVWEEILRHDVFARVLQWNWQQVYELLGKRECGLDLWAELQLWCPDALMQMQQEAVQRKTRTQRETDAGHTKRASDAMADA